MNKTDYARIMASIDEAKEKADYVLISLHDHSLDGDKENVPAFLRSSAGIASTAARTP